MMVSKEIDICKNCKMEFTGSYCPNCGQKRMDQITWKQVGVSILDSLEFNKGLLFNLKQFTLHPATAASNYLNGATKPYLNPISYNVTAIGFLFISIQLFSKFDSEIYGQTEKLVYIVALIFPFNFAFVLFGASIDRGPNYLKGLIVSLFLSGHIILLFVLVRCILFLINKVFLVGIFVAPVLGAGILMFYTVAICGGYLRHSYGNTIIRLILASFFCVAINFLLLGIFGNNFNVSSAAHWLGYITGRLTVILFSFK